VTVYLILPASASCFNVPLSEFGKETVLLQRVIRIEVLTPYVLIFYWRMNTGSVLKTDSKSFIDAARRTVLWDDDASLVSFRYFWVRGMLSKWITNIICVMVCCHITRCHEPEDYHTDLRNPENINYHTGWAERRYTEPSVLCYILYTVYLLLAHFV